VNNLNEEYRIMGNTTDTFQAIDKDHSGLISAEELKAAYRNIPLLHHPNSDKMIDQIMKSIDYDNNGSINYTEFLSGTLDRQILFNQDNLRSLFQFLDSDNLGYLTRDSLVRTFHRANKYYTETDVADMFL
jgi:Ca2+-binding EF-hand superfamily protein